MHQKIQQISNSQLKSDIPEFTTGDRLKVHALIKEGSKERVQVFEGVCISKHEGTKAATSSFTVRKVSDGVGVERIFPLHSPMIKKIELMAHGKTRRSKLYYLRDLFGNAAKIKETVVFNKKKD